MSGFVERVAAEAPKVRPVKWLLTLLAVPFYVVGWFLGFVLVAGAFAVGAAKVGIADAKARTDRSALAASNEGG